MLHGVRVADLMRRQPLTIDADRSLREAADQFFLRYPHKAYPVIQDGRFLGLLTLRALQEQPRDQWEVVRVGDVAAQGGPWPVADPRDPVLDALRKLAESGQSRLAVVEDDALVGLLCHRDVMNLLEIRAGLAPPSFAAPASEAVAGEPAVRSFRPDGRAAVR